MGPGNIADGRAVSQHAQAARVEWQDWRAAPMRLRMLPHVSRKLSVLLDM